MGTGNEYQEIPVNSVMSGPDTQSLQDFNDDEAQDDRNAMLPQDRNVYYSTFVLGSDPETITVGASLMTISVPTWRRFGSFFAQNAIGTWTATGSGFTSVPFEDDGASTYMVGLRHNNFPSEVRARTDGIIYYHGYTNGVGEQDNPTVIAEPVPGAGLRLTVANNNCLPWTVGGTRPVTVWLTTPETTSGDAIYTGTMSIVGAATVIDVPHYFGQSAATYSVVLTDYNIQIHGLSINAVDNLTTTVDATGHRVYATIAEFDSSGPATDYAIQSLVLDQQSLSEASGWAAAYQGATRPGCVIGDYEVTRDWTDPTNIVMANVGPGTSVTFTFTDVLAAFADGYFYSAPGELADKTFATSWKAGGRVVTFDQTEPNDTYYICVYVDPYTHEAYLDYIADASYLATPQNTLKIYEFTWGGAYPPAPLVGVNLNEWRGIAQAHLISSGTDANGEALHVDELVGGNQIAVMMRDDVTTTFSTSAALLLIRDPSAALDTHRLEVVPLGGAGTNLVDETARIEMGGAADYRLVAQHVTAGPSNDFWLEFGAGDVQGFAHVRTDGNSVNFVDKVEAHDFQISDGDGKLVWHLGNPLHGQDDGFGAWASDWQTNRRWDGAASVLHYLLLPVGPLAYSSGAGPAGTTKHTIESFRIYGGSAGAGGAAGDTLDAQLISWDENTGVTSTLTQYNPGVQWDIENAISEWRTPATPLAADIDQDKSYFIRVWLSVQTGAPTPFISHYEWQIRTYEMT
jgi:hypothetical protein